MDRPVKVPDVVDHRDVAAKMKIEYSRGVRDHTTRLLEAVDELMSALNRPNLEPDVIVRQASELITRHLGIASVAIALWDPNDSLFRYKAVTGLDPDVAEGFKKLEYTREQIENAPYPSHEISRHTRLYLTEDHPYTEGEEFSYNRPSLIGMKRRDITDSLEADYLCTYFRDSDGKIVGWADISGTRLRKQPDATTVRWIELICSVVCLALQARTRA